MQERRKNQNSSKKLLVWYLPFISEGNGAAIYKRENWNSGCCFASSICTAITLSTPFLCSTYVVVSEIIKMGLRTKRKDVCALWTECHHGRGVRGSSCPGLAYSKSSKNCKDDFFVVRVAIILSSALSNLGSKRVRNKRLHFVLTILKSAAVKSLKTEIFFFGYNCIL